MFWLDSVLIEFTAEKGQKMPLFRQIIHDYVILVTLTFVYFRKWSESGKNIETFVVLLFINVVPH